MGSIDLHGLQTLGDEIRTVPTWSLPRVESEESGPTFHLNYGNSLGSQTLQLPAKNQGSPGPPGVDDPHSVLTTPEPGPVYLVLEERQHTCQPSFL